MMIDKLLHIIYSNGKNTLAMGTGEAVKIISYSGFEAPDYLIHTDSNADQDGSSVTGKKVDERVINIVFGVDDSVNEEVYRKQIEHLFNPKNTTKLQVNHIYSQAIIYGEIQSFRWEQRQTLWDTLVGSVTFKCPYPYWQDLDNFGKNIAAITPQWIYPLPFVIFGENKMSRSGQIAGYRTLTANVSLFNAGDVPTGVEVVFVAKKGPVKNPKIMKNSTGQFVEVIQDMVLGDEVRVNTNVGKKGITFNGQNIFNKKNKLSEFFSLDVGDNTISYSAAENDTNLEVRVYYTPKYLGV